ncbi:MAG: hypothetical protein K2J08_05925 [Ruminococcus sp.]|nr:hypothetical protein [Ruminococcus sp.]
MNNFCDLMLDLLLEHCHKFEYDAQAIPEIRILFDKSIFGDVNNSTLELKKLLEDSLRDNIDYLPERYGYNAEDLMGDENAILIDYYDH